MPTYRQLFFNYINANSQYLTKTVIENLFCDVCGLDKSNLLLNFDKEVNNLELFEKSAKRIIEGEPYQYVLSKAEFLGIKLYVDKNVLIPRQETEQLVLDLIQQCKQKFGDKKIRILDIGCGSGNISILLKKHLQNADIFAIDVSNEALYIASKNAIKNDVDVIFSNIDVFDKAIYKFGKFDVIVSNPPYIKNSSTVSKQTLNYEPHIALFASPQTCFYERIFTISKKILKKDWIISVEIDEDMKESLEPLINKQYSNILYQFSFDLYNKLRFLHMENIIGNNTTIAANALLNSKVIAIPTDTVMGLAAIYNDKEAYELLGKIKHRPADKPYSLMVACKNDIRKYAVVDMSVSRLISKLMPGPLTLLLNARDNVPGHVTHNTGIIGIRVAPNKIVRNIIKKAGSPLLVPSANISGEPPAKNSDEVYKMFGNSLGYICEGSSELGQASTIVDLTLGYPKIVREGKIDMETIIKSMEETSK